MAGKVKIGLEIHIQLQGRKLFCNCPTETSGETEFSFERKLTATTGESGKFDPAAVYEKSRSRRFLYRPTDNSCLLEADEEPPHNVNLDALRKAIAVSIALNCKVVDEVAYMRKIVIDGSNTSGFQRTAIIGFNGYVDTSKGRVGISSLCLEEDSARKLSEENGLVVYSLDRLGVPLMEIATDPDIIDEDHAVETAELIGKKVLLAGWARKAPDAIRQDVNFSMGYGRVEIKGVPKLSTIRDALSYEAQRQAWISELAPLIRKNEWSRIQFKDVSETFKNTKSKMISRSLSEGLKVYGTVLPGLSGLLKHEPYKVGRELADVAKLFGSGGIMHSDELPGYGVGPELTGLVNTLSPQEGDGYTIIVSTPKVIDLIQEAMIQRLRKLAELELSETRVVSEDGTTHYLRPLPGGERMYPETDIQLIPVDRDLLKSARQITPRSEEEMIEGLISDFGISRQDASVILSTGRREDLAHYSHILSNSRLASRIILQTIPEIERKIGRYVSRDELTPILEESGKRNWSREILETALSMLLVKKMPPAEILSSEELKPLGKDELRAIILNVSRDEEVSEKNVIPKIRSRTRRMFDPTEAIEIAKELRS